MLKQKVLFIGDLDKSLPEFVEFEKKFECIFYNITTKDQLIEDFKTKFQDISAIYGAWLGFVPVGGFYNEVLANSPPGLKVISICSVGYDGYDGEEMRKNNIVLTNVPSNGAAGPVADLVLFNTLASFRQFKFYADHFHKDQNHTVQTRMKMEQSTFDQISGKVRAENHPGYSFGHTLLNRQCLSPNGHDAVIVGFGNIGQTIARRLAGIGMRIHYVKRTPLLEQESGRLPFEAKYHASLEDVTSFADLVVVACPGTPETKHMVNGKIIDAFERQIRIINIGRGTVIDESALVAGLKSGKVLFAGLDVFEQEPSVHPELFGREDVILTPHIGASTVENFDYTAISAMKNIENVLLENGPGLYPVN